MNTEVAVYSGQQKKIYYLGNSVTKISLEQQMAGQPGKMEISYIDTGAKVDVGDVIQLSCDGRGIFSGIIFTVSYTQEETVKITAYDQIRYLKNSDTIIFSSGTLSERVKAIANGFNLRTGEIEDTGFILPQGSFDNRTLGDMIQDGINSTQIGSGNLFVLRDNFGKLELKNILHMYSGLVLGEGSLATSYELSSSIDKDTYNRIKYIMTDSNTKQQTKIIEEDISTQAKWGVLQFFAKADDKMNEAQVRQMAKMTLALRNRPGKSLSINALGDFRVYAGCLVMVDISKMEENKPKPMVVTRCSHELQNALHTMSLELQEYAQ